ncbi:TPA: ADP-ribosylglycohydrolase family protein [Pseudomonas aeruginosa]|uniref:ADP-ribosylglycohydrolase family protein n=1 Tax=Pseudomonas aeruginosa TaxID=287 RepID=UPI0009A34419|nr:ADP-ribosylglycohydrolase family protein [Pseudomonas aeruginosa]EIU1437382.1 ADP-ribosylglycohydrolase family protein [Pseudomonas aeruginosa]EKU4051570.1 ADP-ribosylglycohydrolase family protein [Pseudomonas aeruginosa]EKX7956454.1 ADP-ribosylglycohydrolase family protein [Pseudomonas aeruginosa]EKX9337986.1 ADP-ribosylglycohydrolase family protein [Pseudomonas aeruginosa]MBX5687363.1 ADP-ribosylglycohydrolase family protein [Pseudomonas aeruginosa]
MRPNIENSIVNSALWAAAADALGWITELVDKKGVVRRTGKGKVLRTVPWKRKIGGIAGVTVELPAGTYSDDTQLRLAICRSIQGDGFFDVEAFAKVELSTWSSYALGAGRGTKVAAANIAKRDVNWFSNFYSQGDQIYFQGGGNGAAMRIQPHVWRRSRGPNRDYLADVIKDSIVTHGHMRGVCGAVFHADCLAYILETGHIPGPEEWIGFVASFDEILSAVRSDFQLGKFWLSAWEQGSGSDLGVAIEAVSNEMRSYISRLGEFPVDVESGYTNALEVLGCLSDRVGTGTNTALAAAYLAWVGQDQPIEMTIQLAVNTLGSDTDTIGTMVGALLGGIAMNPPSWPIQDEAYIRYQAVRMSRIAQGISDEGFRYPDLMTWQPPSSQSNALQFNERGYFLNGFGNLESISKSWNSGSFAWEWFKMPFGQTILCKHRLRKPVYEKESEALILSRKSPHFSDLHRSERMSSAQVEHGDQNLDLPLFADQAVTNSEVTLKEQGKPTDFQYSDKAGSSGSIKQSAVSSETRSVGELTDLVIKSNFDSAVLGKCFLECVTGELAIENAIAFSAIIAKAIDVRQKKNSSGR